jgi:hypothetical protein
VVNFSPVFNITASNLGSVRGQLTNAAYQMKDMMERMLVILRDSRKLQGG